MTNLEAIKGHINDFHKRKEELVEQVRSSISLVFADLLKESTLIESISWTQYTPYFNDGDSCEFSVNGVYTVNGDDMYSLSWYDWKVVNPKYTGSDYKVGTDVDECKRLQEFTDVLFLIPSEIMKDIFGDHSEITVNKDGTFEVTEYEHD